MAERSSRNEPGIYVSQCGTEFGTCPEGGSHVCGSYPAHYGGHGPCTRCGKP